MMPEQAVAGESARRANVLWIMADQLRADCLGFAGNPVVQTPNLDRLAASGVIFDNAFCQSPACMASRAVLFTGRYPTAVRVRGMGLLPPSETTFPEVLRRQGYRTAAFGLVHLTPQLYTLNILGSQKPTLDWRKFAADSLLPQLEPDPMKENYGFEVHLGHENHLQGNFHDWLRTAAPELLDKKKRRVSEDGPGDLFISPYSSEFHPTTYVASHAAEFVRAQTKDKPWFAFCSFVAPHHPFEAPEEEIAAYPLADIPPPAWKGGVERQFIPRPAADAIDQALSYPEEIRRRIIQHYYAAISLIDRGVGQVLDALDESGQADNTLVIFVSDHGEFLGNHGLLRKPAIYYDETLRVPLVIRPPQGVPPRRESGLVELTDVFPTLLGLLSIPGPKGVQGRNWSESIWSGQDIGREDVHSANFDQFPMFGGLKGPYMAVESLRTVDWKLNLYPTAGAEFGQLFDLRNDPDESRNLYADPARSGVRSGMLWQLAQRLHNSTDPLPPLLSQW